MAGPRALPAIAAMPSKGIAHGVHIGHVDAAPAQAKDANRLSRATKGLQHGQTFLLRPTTAAAERIHDTRTKAEMNQAWQLETRQELCNLAHAKRGLPLGNAVHLQGAQGATDTVSAS